MKKQIYWLIWVLVVMMQNSYVMAKLQVEVIRQWEQSDAVEIVAFSPDSRLLAVTTANNSITIWEVESGEWLHTLSGHGEMISSVAFSPSGKWLAAGSMEKSIKLWDVESGRYKILCKIMIMSLHWLFLTIANGLPLAVMIKPSNCGI